MESSKTTSIRHVLEGFALLVTSHWFANKYLVFSLVEVVPDLPWITASIIVATLSPLIASIYMVIRMRSTPCLFAKSKTLTGVISGLILTWLLLFIEALFMGKGTPLAKEMLQAKSYVPLMLFLLAIWGPLWEETLFRGYFFETLRQTCGDTLGLFFSSFLFAGSHGIFTLIYEGSLGFGLVFLFLTSLVFTLIYVQGGLSAAVITHGFVNSYLIYLSM